MPLKHKIFVVILISMFGNTLLAQNTDTLELPFFDDFSYNATQPNNLLWQNSGVTISNTIPKQPPSIGVAVFDALDINGNFYPADYNYKYSHADTLTSKPINLYYPGDNTIYLTFYYQPGGYSDAPEPEDSLLLDFYSPQDNQWTTIKTYAGTQCHNFKQESIAITQKYYLQKGFKFRFRNYFSLGSAKQADLVSNCDFWLIDYIKLDKMRSATDTVYQDIALTNCPEIKINEYQNVPWQHYLKAKDKTKISYQIFYRNNDREPRMLDSINLIFKSNNINDTLMLGSYNLPSYWNFSEQKQFSYTFKSNDDTAKYQIGIKLVSDVSQQDFAPNNLYFSDKLFADYYAYDDGTSEAGYGINGEGSTGSMVAIKFTPLTTDNIKGVYIYFNQTFRNAQADFFHLKIWNNNNGLPGEELYSEDNIAIPKQECGNFVYFPLKNNITIADTFFVGWQKTQNEIINIGFDKSTTSVANNYYNINGVWKKSSEKGQIMIRPAFGSISTDNTPIVSDLQSRKNINISPNPATNHITISGLPLQQNTLYIISTTGKIVKTITTSDNIECDISDIAAGIYFVQTADKALIAKFVKIK